MNKDCYEAYYNKGCVLENLGKIEESNKCYEKAFAGGEMDRIK